MMKLKYKWIDSPDKQLPEEYPEKRGVIDQSHRRIASAMKMFDENFKDDGQPKTRAGKKLYKKHYVPAYGETIKYSPPLLRRIRLLIRKLIRYMWSNVVFQKSNRK